MLDMEFAEPEEAEEAMPSLNHSYLCTQLLRQLLQKPDIIPLAELTLNIEKGLTPDISIYPAGKIAPDFFNDVFRYDEPPIIAIEIVSASQHIQRILRKAEQLAEAGVSTVLTLEPFTRTVFITRKGEENRLVHNQPVEVEGITIDFKAIFEKH